MIGYSESTPFWCHVGQYLGRVEVIIFIAILESSPRSSVTLRMIERLEASFEVIVKIKQDGKGKQRDMAIRERKTALNFDFDVDPGDQYLGNGIGVSGGAMSGRAVFTVNEIERWRETEPETDLILIRGDTVPDDIEEIHASDGVLTARGGLTSHASVVAHRLGKTCVVGCGTMVCNEKEKTAMFNQVVIRSGDHISIDGREGSVYQGTMRIQEA